jgi:predicted alpha/beta hydrolase family esterase
MKTSDADILIVPGWLNSGPDHWQSRWERNLKSAKRIEQDSWHAPDKDEWTGNIIKAVENASRPAVLVAHSLGVIAVAYAAPKLPAGSVAGAFLVAPADVDNTDGWPENQGNTWPPESFGFAPVPMQRLPFPSLLLAAEDDPYCSQARAKALALAWGSNYVDVGQAGHIADQSGHGPWPDGLLRFGRFLADLKN